MEAATATVNNNYYTITDNQVLQVTSNGTVTLSNAPDIADNPVLAQSYQASLPAAQNSGSPIMDAVVAYISAMLPTLNQAGAATTPTVTATDAPQTGQTASVLQRDVVTPPQTIETENGGGTQTEDHTASETSETAADDAVTEAKQPEADKAKVMSSEEQKHFEAQWKTSHEGQHALVQGKESDDPDFESVEGTTYSYGPGYVVIDETVFYDNADQTSAQHARYEKALDSCKKWDMVNHPDKLGLSEEDMGLLNLESGDKRGEDFDLARDDDDYPVFTWNSNSIAYQSEEMKEAGLIAWRQEGNEGETTIVSSDLTPELYDRLYTNGNLHN